MPTLGTAAAVKLRTGLLGKKNLIKWEYLHGLNKNTSLSSKTDQVRLLVMKL